MTIVADTHALIWWFQGSAELSAVARQALEEAHRQVGGGVVVSMASRIDLHYIVRKKKLDLDTTEAAQVWALTQDPATNVLAAPVTVSVVERFATLPAAMRDPWDRLIVATALELDVPLVTRDDLLTELAPGLGLTTVW